MKSLLFKMFAVGVLLVFASLNPTMAAKPEAAPDRKAAQHTSALLEAFYTAYCQDVAGPGSDPELFERHATKELAAKVKQVRENKLYDPLIKAQDFNEKAIETITSTHVDGNWYTVGYFDVYARKCVLIPMQVRLVDDQLRIDDIAIE